MPDLKIATFNINGIRARLPILLQWLQREAPDIVCLQELKADDAAFPIEAIRSAGYDAVWHGQRSWNGVAILAAGQPPLESRRGLPGDPTDQQSRYIEAVAHGVIVGCLYLPNGNPQPGPKFDYKLAWFERLIDHARTLHGSGHPVVLAGDYNVVPTDELDIYDPKSWRKDALLQPQTRECYRRLLAQGWTDALRTLHPDERIYTFWDYFRQHWPRNAGLRIDHLLLSPDLAPRLRAGGVDRWVRDLPKASDHAPAWVRLDVVGQAPARSTVRTTTRSGRAASRGQAGAGAAAKPAASGTIARGTPGKLAPTTGSERMRDTLAASNNASTTVRAARESNPTDTGKPGTRASAPSPSKAPAAPGPKSKASAGPRPRRR